MSTPNTVTIDGRVYVAVDVLKACIANLTTGDAVKAALPEHWETRADVS